MVLEKVTSYLGKQPFPSVFGYFLLVLDVPGFTEQRPIVDLKEMKVLSYAGCLLVSQ